jgi:hypothetical protein
MPGIQQELASLRVNGLAKLQACLFAEMSGAGHSRKQQAGALEKHLLSPANGKRSAL